MFFTGHPQQYGYQLTSVVLVFYYANFKPRIKTLAVEYVP